MFKRLTPGAIDWKAAASALDDCFGPKDVELRTAFVPYRIRPLGAHLDHQGGKVLSQCTSFGVTGYWRRNGLNRVRVSSHGFGQADIDLNADLVSEADGFDYLRGTLAQFRANEYPLIGIDLLVDGALTACGLSSSAAITLLYQELLCQSMRVSLEAEQRIDWAVACENHFIGVQSGVGDQTPMLFAGDGESVLYDCRLREAKRIVPKDPWRFLVINSGQTAALSGSSSFNDRVAESIEAAREIASLLKRPLEGARLGDFSDAEWSDLTSRLSATAQRRSAHFFTEMTRVHAGEKALLAGDPVRFGALMNASCQSSIDQYETGTNLLIELVRHLQAIDGVYGARFSGAGTRGCVVALIEDDADRHILNDLAGRVSPDIREYADQQWAFTTSAHAGLKVS